MSDRTNRLKQKPVDDEQEFEIDSPLEIVNEIEEEESEETEEADEEFTEVVTEKKVKKPRAKKTEEEAAKEKKPKKEKPASSITKIIQFIRSERFVKITGLFLILFTVFLAVSFVSYLFTGAADRSAVYPFNWQIFIDASVKAENLMGKFGAYISHLFIWNGYGLAAFLTLPFIFSFGFNLLLQKKVLPTAQIFRHAFAQTIILAPALAFIFQNKLFPFGGAFGVYINYYLLSFLGQVGTGTILGFGILGYLVATFNFSFSPKEKIQIENDTDDEFNPQVVTVDKSKAFTLVPTAETPPPTAQVNKLKEIQENVIPLTTEITNEPEEELITTDENGFDEVTDEQREHAEDYDEDLELDIVETPEEQMADTFENAPLDLYDPTLDLSDYKFPDIELLEYYGSEKIKIDPEELERNKNQIISTLQNYGIEISKIKATVGPTVTLYEIIPAPGVRVNKIKNLEDDIALSLAALGIRIIAPMPGKGTIGIEVPNINKEVVSMRTLLSSEKFQTTTFDLPMALGKTISNEIFIADLSKMPHLLVAGATGQGKSVGLNAILTSLLFKKHPSQLKFVMVDPKMVELSLYSLIEKHFLAKLPNEEKAIITETTNPSKVVNTLKSLCIEMDNRYILLTEANCRNLKEYNEKFVNRKLNPNKGHRFMPFIVVVIDEFGDLIMTAGKEIETPIARIAQKARAVGIHLIIATQRPSVNIITGTIKANFPARIAFKVSSKIDSRTILDAGGADQLIGKGDMLIYIGGEMIRLQCAFIDTPEVEKVTRFIQEQRGYPEAYALPEVLDEQTDGNGGFDAMSLDERFADAARLIVQHQQGSTSLLQRRMNLGYNRSGRLMDQLEQAGIVGPNQGSKAREVLIKDMDSLEQFLNNLGEKV